MTRTSNTWTLLWCPTSSSFNFGFLSKSIRRPEHVRKESGLVVKAGLQGQDENFKGVIDEKFQSFKIPFFFPALYAFHFKSSSVHLQCYHLLRCWMIDIGCTLKQGCNRVPDYSNLLYLLFKKKKKKKIISGEIGYGTKSVQ